MQRNWGNFKPNLEMSYRRPVDDNDKKKVSMLIVMMCYKAKDFLET